MNGARREFLRNVGRVALVSGGWRMGLARGAAGASGALAIWGGQRARASGSIEGGWFFTETGGGDGKGFAVTDDNGIPFWTFFQKQGGVQQLGFPVARPRSSTMGAIWSVPHA